MNDAIRTPVATQADSMDIGFVIRPGYRAIE